MPGGVCRRKVRFAFQSQLSPTQPPRTITGPKRDSLGVTIPCGVLSNAALLRSLVTQSLYVFRGRLGMPLDPKVFALHSPATFQSRGNPPIGFRSPTEYDWECPCDQPILTTVALLGFRPLRRFRTSGAHLPRVYLTRYVALSGFLNLLALSFSRRLPAYFSR